MVQHCYVTHHARACGWHTDTKWNFKFHCYEIKKIPRKSDYKEMEKVSNEFKLNDYCPLQIENVLLLSLNVVQFSTDFTGGNDSEMWNPIWTHCVWVTHALYYLGAKLPVEGHQIRGILLPFCGCYIILYCIRYMSQSLDMCNFTRSRPVSIWRLFSILNLNKKRICQRNFQPITKQLCGSRLLNCEISYENCQGR